MHRVPAFDVTDPVTIARLIREFALARVVTHDAGGLTASTVPLVLDEPPDGPWRLRGHLARANPQARGDGSARPCLALFLGPQAYVSPSAYATKAETGKVVPTWNYVEVQVHGTFRLTDDPAVTLAVVTDLTDAHEADRPEPWHVTDAPDGYVDGMVRGIVAFEIEVSHVEAKAKLSQNKSEADRRGVIADLAGRPGGAAVADLMASGEFDRPDA